MLDSKMDLFYNSLLICSKKHNSHVELKVRALCFHANTREVLLVTGLQSLRLSKPVLASPVQNVTSHVLFPFQFGLGGAFMPLTGDLCLEVLCMSISVTAQTLGTLYMFQKKNVSLGLLKSPNPSRVTCPVQGVQHTLSDCWDRPLLPSAWASTSFHGSWHLHSSSSSSEISRD